MKGTPPYDQVRMVAWNLLQRLENSDSFADLMLARTFVQTPDLRPVDQAFIAELVWGTLRWRGRLDRAIDRTLRHTPSRVDPRLRHLLRLGSYQILFLDRVPDSAAVNESVRLARAFFKNEKIAGFVNALLRSIARNKDREEFPPFPEEPIDHIVQALSHPRWMVERWVREFGPETTREMCLANNFPPPFTIRTNTLKISRKELKVKLEVLGIPSFRTPFSPDGLILEKSPILSEDELFQRGMYFIQGEASQLISHLLGPKPGERVLDACAAPGGKTTHLAQIMENRGEIVVLDFSPSRIHRLRENCSRLGVEIVKAFASDSSQSLPFPRELAFDRVLLDAPCTGLGILHRNPETKWRRTPQDILRLQKLQRKLLENVSSWLKPGGVLIYSTCTVTPEENEGIVQAFLDRHEEYAMEDLRSWAPKEWGPLFGPEGFFRTYPQMTTRRCTARLDGFFAARLRKNVQE